MADTSFIWGLGISGIQFGIETLHPVDPLVQRLWPEIELILCKLLVWGNTNFFWIIIQRQTVSLSFCLLLIKSYFEGRQIVVFVFCQHPFLHGKRKYCLINYAAFVLWGICPWHVPLVFVLSFANSIYSWSSHKYKIVTFKWAKPQRRTLNLEALRMQCVHI